MTYVSECFLISSLSKLLSKYQVQKGVQSGVKDQKTRSTLCDL